ncbi:MAG: TIR domain-containing protein [Magnetococcales bacterium]|nr:TIR domain-containing protein [Magnetococcales bacterium]
MFISYASVDYDWKDRLLGHLMQMALQGLILPWVDRFIETGEEWEEEIFRQMELADAAILLVSDGFLNSRFIQEEEIPRLRQRYEKRELKIYPLIIKPCDFEKHDLIGKIHFLGNNRLPLSQYHHPHLTYTHVVAHLKNLILPLHQTINQGQDTSTLAAPPSPHPLTKAALLDKLPKTNPRLFGREREMSMLDGMQKGVMVWVAGGGAGKSALVRHWLINSDWPKKTHFLGHSFYSQGSKDQTSSSASFLHQALQDLGVSYPLLGDYQLGELLAQTLRGKPTVLVLDGVEPLQHGPDGHYKLGGLFKDQGLVGLLSELARQPGEVVCLVSSRVHLADLSLQEKKGRFIWQHDLNMLPVAAAVELLKYRGVNGFQKDLEATARRYNCHALALVLVSEYLHTFHQGRVERALKIRILDESIPSGSHAKSVMRAYDLALQKAGEELDREMVRLLGLFDRPAEWHALEALQKADPIPGLTQHFRHASQTQVEESLARLRQWGLLNPGSPTAPLDSHPLVREWFGQAFQKEFPTFFAQAHKILFRHYQQEPKKHHPNTLEEMEPLFRAIRHGCLAGEYEEALHKVYRDRIQRVDQYYSTRNLGTHSSDLSALSGFFPHGFDQMPVTGLSEQVRSWLVAQASFLLMSLGRLREAVGPRRVGMKMVEQLEHWTGAAISAQDLTDLLLSLGQLGEASRVAEQGIAFASRIEERGKNLVQRLYCHAFQGRVFHNLGRMAEAGRAFQQAEALQKRRQPSSPRLYSLAGTSYALFLLEQTDSQREREEIFDRGITIGERFLKSRPMENAFGKLVTGLAMESLDCPTEGASQVQSAVADMRQASMYHYLPWLLLSLAGVLHRLGELEQAKTQLAQAMEIAERGEMVLYLAEGHLLTGLIAVDEGRREEARAAHQQAKSMIEEMGYLRVQGELLLLEGRIEKSNALLGQARNQWISLGQLGLLERYKKILPD